MQAEPRRADILLPQDPSGSQSEGVGEGVGVMNVSRTFFMSVALFDVMR